MSTPALERVIRRAALRRQQSTQQDGQPGQLAPHGKQPSERCELCSDQVPTRHRHVLDTGCGELLCACPACAILFDREEASRGRYRLVPTRRMKLAAFSPAAVGVPVSLAFFVRQPDGSVLAHYPSPAGATQWEADREAWEAVTGRHPVLLGLAPQVEAVLVNALRGSQEAWLVPIDDCFRLVAAVRQHWQGLSGGDAIWRDVEAFFMDLRRSDGQNTSRQATGEAGHSDACGRHPAREHTGVLQEAGWPLRGRNG